MVMEKRYNDDNTDPIELWLKLLAAGLVVVSSSMFAFIGYCIYKILTGAYHLLDKLIDKI